MVTSLKFANAPCSWGALEFEEFAGESAGYAQVLDEIRESGYSGTELGDWGFMPTEPGELGRQLSRRNLELVGAFVPVAFAQRDAWPQGQDTALQTARLLRDVAATNPYLVLADDNGTDPERTRCAGRIQPEQGLSAENWALFAEGLQLVAQAVRDETGLRVVFHHHCGGYVETSAELARLLELTDPDLVGLCFDTGHFRFGGGDPAAAMETWADRIWHLHFKDCDPQVAQRSRQQGWDYFRSVQEGVFCELGRGDVDFAAISELALSTGKCEWITVEQDVLPGMGSPLECAKRNRDYLKSLGL